MGLFQNLAQNQALLLEGERIKQEGAEKIRQQQLDAERERRIQSLLNDMDVMKSQIADLNKQLGENFASHVLDIMSYKRVLKKELKKDNPDLSNDEIDKLIMDKAKTEILELMGVDDFYKSAIPLLADKNKDQ